MSAAGAAPAPAHFAAAAEIGAHAGFYRERPRAAAVFRRRGPLLLVSFCHLARLAFEPGERLPWLYRRAKSQGWSHLGVMTRQKDWYRNPDAPALLREIAGEGFFEGFDRVVFAGTSMGGFAALNFQDIVPGSEVIAYSPQSTLNTEIAPFETRYSWPRRRFDWTTPDYLDASLHVGRADRALVFFDPMVPEDKAHALRLEAGGAELVACPLMGHMLPNALKRAGVLDLSLAMAMEGTWDRSAFFAAFRQGRRGMTTWRKELVRRALAHGQTRRAIRVCDVTMQDMPGPWFRKTRARLMEEETTA